jgi:hypothetical protein
MKTLQLSSKMLRPLSLMKIMSRIGLATLFIFSAQASSLNLKPTKPYEYTFMVSVDSFAYSGTSERTKKSYLLTEELNNSLVVYQLTQHKPLLRVPIAKELPEVSRKSNNNFYQLFTSLNDTMMALLDGSDNADTSTQTAPESLNLSQKKCSSLQQNEQKNHNLQLTLI